jgi:hypothetical protein
VKISLFAPLAALLLIASPALAKNSTITAPSLKTPACVSSAAIKVKFKTLPVLLTLDGDKLAAFKADFALPAAIDTMLVFGAKGSKVFFGVGFSKDCAIGYASIDPEVASELTGETKRDDGSI